MSSFLKHLSAKAAAIVRQSWCCLLEQRLCTLSWTLSFSFYSFPTSKIKDFSDKNCMITLCISKNITCSHTGFKLTNICWPVSQQLGVKPLILVWQFCLLCMMSLESLGNMGENLWRIQNRLSSQRWSVIEPEDYIWHCLTVWVSRHLQEFLGYPDEIREVKGLHRCSQGYWRLTRTVEIKHVITILNMCSVSDLIKGGLITQK